MDREPLTPPCTPPALLLLALLPLAGCEVELPYEGAFDLPTAVAVLQPETGGPFEEPVGFVANGVGGNIIPLDLKSGRFLTDDPTASFLRTNWLPTGQARMLAAVAPYAPEPGQVTLYAGDRAFETLVRVPYIVRIDEAGFPVEGWIDDDGELQTGPVVAEVVDEAPEAGIGEIVLKDGWTSTETWRVEFEPVRREWVVTGTRSGLQEKRVLSGERFVGDRRRIAFTIEGQGTEGAFFEIRTDNGVREIDVGGIPHEMAMSPDQSLLAMSVGDAVLDRSVLRFLDPDTDEIVLEPLLDDEAEPGRMAWSPDATLLFVADSNRPALWEVPADGSTVTEHIMPWPTFDVTPLFSLEFGRLLYVVPVERQEVWIYDLDAGAFIDVNTAIPGVQGMTFDSPVLGVEAIPLPHLFQEVTDDGVRRSGRSVAVSLHEGQVVFMEEGTGCLLQDELGPRTVLEGTLGTTSDVQTNFDDVPFGAFLQQNIGNDRRVTVNACAGIAREEAWTLRFDRNEAAWVVEGGISGRQDALAFEDERYLSDQGEVSFVVRAGSVPSQEGWEMTFSVLDGILAADGDNDDDGERDIPFDVPGDPAFFQYVVGPTDGDWKQVDDRAFVLVPGQASDVVGRVNPEEGTVEVGWD